MKLKEKLLWAAYIAVGLAVEYTLFGYGYQVDAILAIVIMVLLCYCITSTQALHSLDARVCHLQKLLTEREYIMNHQNDRINELVRRNNKLKNRLKNEK